MITSQGIDKNSASFLLSIIGMTNTVGRVACGYVADFPQVDSLLLNNICLVISTIAVAATPLCHSYTAYIIMSIAFGIAICKFFQLFSKLSCCDRVSKNLKSSVNILVEFQKKGPLVKSPLGKKGTGRVFGVCGIEGVGGCKCCWVSFRVCGVVEWEQSTKIKELSNFPRKIFRAFL